MYRGGLCVVCDLINAFFQRRQQVNPRFDNDGLDGGDDLKLRLRHVVTEFCAHRSQDAISGSSGLEPQNTSGAISACPCGSCPQIFLHGITKTTATANTINATAPA
jgi:hypothetical protein